MDIQQFTQHLSSSSSHSSSNKSLSHNEMILFAPDRALSEFGLPRTGVLMTGSEKRSRQAMNESAHDLIKHAMSVFQDTNGPLAKKLRLDLPLRAT
jgi:hypothetical protein